MNIKKEIKLTEKEYMKLKEEASRTMKEISSDWSAILNMAAASLKKGRKRPVSGGKLIDIRVEKGSVGSGGGGLFLMFCCLWALLFVYLNFFYEPVWIKTVLEWERNIPAIEKMRIYLLSEFFSGRDSLHLLDIGLVMLPLFIAIIGWVIFFAIFLRKDRIAREKRRVELRKENNLILRKKLKELQKTKKRLRALRRMMFAMGKIFDEIEGEVEKTYQSLFREELGMKMEITKVFVRIMDGAEIPILKDGEVNEGFERLISDISIDIFRFFKEK